ncbi:transport-associated protein [Calothrix sp. PCC 6303]|uniref:transport-associated protein n=1 Tax=Calothrix sp. PCC 6303 TaxID=1170562 RepID=UPI0002A04651|nr:transport-associated protein [Calothrix sp. PCC 6303]AFZ02621.1 transport-associated protein [Calothrix sp. PCC 6303]
MKKLIPFLISSVLVVGAVGCNSDTKTSETTTTTDSTAVKEAGQKTQGTTTTTKTTEKTTTAVKDAAGGVKTIVKNKLEKQFPGSSLQVNQAGDVLTVSGTVPDEATLKKIEPAVKENKFEGVKTVKVDVKVAAKKAQ